MDEKPQDKNTASAAEEQRLPVYDMARKLLLAAVGAASLAQEEMEIIITRLVERGEIAEKDAHRLVSEVIERRDRLEKEKRDAAARRSSSAPASKEDVQALMARIAELSAQVEDLKREKQARRETD